jgi:hypothetical protein
MGILVVSALVLLTAAAAFAAEINLGAQINFILAVDGVFNSTAGSVNTVVLNPQGVAKYMLENLKIQCQYAVYDQKGVEIPGAIITDLGVGADGKHRVQVCMFKAVQWRLVAQGTYAFSDPSVSRAYAFPSVVGVKNGKVQHLTFARVPKNARIRIYTPTGELAWETTVETDAGVVDYDITNLSGMTLASGGYIYFIDAPGQKTRTGTFAVLKK